MNGWAAVLLIWLGIEALLHVAMIGRRKPVQVFTAGEAIAFIGMLAVAWLAVSP